MDQANVPEPVDVALGPEEARVVACLVEKQATVPDSYPMTLNGLRSACNQSSNRDPVVDYDEHTVLAALDGLKVRRLVRFVHAAHGSRTTRYRHVLDEALGLSPGELALLTVLVLRGPQTAGELRSRAERQHDFDSIGAVEAVLHALADRADPLVRLLGREAGRREPRWVQLLTGEPDPAALAAPPPVATAGRSRADEVAVLRAELDDLRGRFDELCRRLGEEV
ncbi:MAG: YceH family protein [Acidimicrobiia bacterium]